MTSVSAWAPAARAARPPRRSARACARPAARTVVARAALARGRDHADAQRLVRKSASPGRAPSLRAHLVGVRDARDRQAVLRLGVVDGVPADEARARRARTSGRRAGLAQDGARRRSSGKPPRFSAVTGRPPIA